MKRRTFLAAMAVPAGAPAAEPRQPALDAEFHTPPAEARPWVYWFWINGNISKEGITADLEAMKRVGVGGVLWMEVSGPWWAPDGEVTPMSPQWHEAIQWAISECRRLGMQFDLSVDFGYGSGGPHITPAHSMQQLVWTEIDVDGGRSVSVELEKPVVRTEVSAWLRPGEPMPAKVLDALRRDDGYRDVAVIAIPRPHSAEGRAYRIPELDRKSGLSPTTATGGPPAPPADAVTPFGRVIDVTSRMDRGGKLVWDAPEGRWTVIRYGHASNRKMTRPSPAAAMGLECDRLAKAGIESHFDAFLKKLFQEAGSSAGRSLTYVHIDSWEAGGQNWTATFPAEFQKRRGYDLHHWLPVMTGRVVASGELSERFLWDIRTTVSEMIRDNYAGRLKELARPFGLKLSAEAYGRLCIDNLAYAGLSDLPISEFWAKGTGMFPTPGGYETSSKAMASAAHSYGRRVVGAEAFTSDRGWRDHPFLLKAMGDKAFTRGINRFIFHLSAHQSRSDMIPGLTHRRWGEHFQRHNTWWEYSKAWIDYLARCQYLLQQGMPVADVCYWFGEGAPLSVDEMDLEIPAGYGYDFVSSEIVPHMKVEQDRIVLPSGVRYRYLLMPDTDRITAPLARKIQELADGGARIIATRRLVGSPSLADHPRGDAEVARIGAALWDGGRVIAGKSLPEVFRQDRLPPDFQGEGLLFIHRRVGTADVYFVSHQENRPADRVCRFRVNGMQPELWDPESGEIRPLPDFAVQDGVTSVPLHFEPMQSWFVVFRKPGRNSSTGKGRNLVLPRTLREVPGPWQVTFDSRWGGPAQAIGFDKLLDWSKHADPKIHHYSGTAVYRNTLTLSPQEASGKQGRLLIDLGAVEVMARVKLNGRECAVAWKPPYRVDITPAARAGRNELEIDVVNLWINRMIGDEYLPLDSKWKDFETLEAWPDWFLERKLRPSGRFTFTSCRHYTKDSPLAPSGLMGPVVIASAGTTAVR